jgi:hypothetical protein
MMAVLGDLHATGGDRFEFGDGFVEDDCHAGWTLSKWCVAWRPVFVLATRWL